MRRRDNRFHLSKTYKKFAFSYLIVLFLPVICFFYLFIQNYREIYRNKIIEQASYSLKTVGQELERSFENFQAIAEHNSVNGQMTKYELMHDYSGSKTASVLAVELFTHNALGDVHYYNEVKPEQVYTPEGTYSVFYYSRLWKEMQSEEQFLENLRKIKNTKLQCWHSQDDTEETSSETIVYVIRYDYNAWWMFHFDPKELNQLLQVDKAVTLLQDGDGNVLGSVFEPVGKDCYEIVYEASDGDFQLVRYIEKEILFEEVNVWQRYFFFVVMGILLASGILIFILTYYHGSPIEELVTYCREKIQNIPEDIGGLETFRFSMNALENQIAMSEQQQKRNCLLLCLLYAQDCDEKYFEGDLIEESLFKKAECYRVVLVVSANRHRTELNKITNYMKMLDERKFEIYLIDIVIGGAVIMIAGMSKENDKKLKRELQRIAETVECSVADDIYFYVGSKCTELYQINRSYTNALSGRQEHIVVGKSRVVYFKPQETNNVYSDVDKKRNNKEDLLASILAYIDENSRSSNLCVSMVADHFDMDISQISHMFKKQTGSNISDYINKKRFSYACELLLQSEYSVKDIALMVGYSHPVSFIRKFKQQYGMTPLEYKEEFLDK